VIVGTDKRLLMPAKLFIAILRFILALVININVAIIQVIDMLYINMKKLSIKIFPTFSHVVPNELIL
jgi:hypothetical protein